MKYNREFEIAWQGLKPGEHLFEYEVDNRFIQKHGDSSHEFEQIAATVRLKFDKKANFFMLHFDIGGYVVLPCDRCGDDFKLNLWDEFNMLIKILGEEDSEIVDEADVSFISRNDSVIDVSKWIYEFIMLSIPLQRIHPALADGRPGCNPDAISLLNSLSDSDSDGPSNPSLRKGLDVFLANRLGNK